MPSFVDHEKPSVGLEVTAGTNVLDKASVMLAGTDEVDAGTVLVDVGAELVVLFVPKGPSP